PQLTFPAETIGEMAGRAMIERGHTRIGFIATHASSAVTGYQRGLRRVLDDAGAGQSDDWVYVADLVNVEHIYEHLPAELPPWLASLMARSDRPTSFFTTFSTVGEIAYLVAMRLGLRVPEDLSIVTVGGTQPQGAVARETAT